MPYTEKQKALFHAKAAEGDPEMAKLAKESEGEPTLPPKRRYMNNTELEKRLRSHLRSEKPRR